MMKPSIFQSLQSKNWPIAIAVGVLALGIALYARQLAKKAITLPTAGTNAYEMIDPRFAAWVAGYTGGAHPRTAPIRVKFVDEICDSASVGQEAPDYWLQLSNSEGEDIDGKLRFVSRNEVQFEPQQPLQWNADYQGSVNLEKAFAVEDPDLTRFSFPIHIMPLAFEVSKGAWHTSPADAQARNLEININTNESLSLAQIKACLSAKMGATDIAITADSVQGQLQVLAGPIVLLDGKTPLDLLVNLASLGIDKEESQASLSWPLPAKGAPVMDGYRTLYKDGGEVNVQLYFTDPLQETTAGDYVKLINPEMNIPLTTSNLKVNDCTVEFDVFFPYEIYSDVKVNVAPGLSDKLNRMTTQAYAFDIQRPSMGQTQEITLQTSGLISPQQDQAIVEMSVYGYQSALLELIPLDAKYLLRNGAATIDNQGRSIGNSYLDWVLPAKPSWRKRVYFTRPVRQGLGKARIYAFDLKPYLNTQVPGYMVRVIADKDVDVIPEAQLKNPKAKSPYLTINGKSVVSAPEFVQWAYSEFIKSRELYNPLYAANSYETEPLLNASILYYSDAQVLAKMADPFQVEFFMFSIAKGTPIVGGRVLAYDALDQIKGQGTTDANGHIKLSATAPIVTLTGIAPEGQAWSPIYLNAKSYESNYSPSQTISLVNAPIDWSGTADTRGKPYLFSERQLYRPGDTVWLHALFPPDEEISPIERKLPIEITIKSPTSATVYQRFVAKDKKVMHKIGIPIDNNAATGYYSAVAKLGASRYVYGYSVETIKPNRIDVNLKLADGGLLFPQSSQTATLSGQFLYGASCAGLDAEVELALLKYAPYFSKWKGWVIGDSLSLVEATEPRKIFQGVLDATGKQTIDLRPYLPAVSQPRNARLISRVVEENGDISTQLTDAVLMPDGAMPALQFVQDGQVKRNTIKPQLPFQLRIMAVDCRTQKATTASMTLRLFKVNYPRWEEEGDQKQEPSYETLLESSSTVTATGASLSFNEGPRSTALPEGEYLLELVAGGTKTRHPFSVSYWSDYYEREQPKGSEIHWLTGLKSDKKQYQPTDEVKIQFDSPVEGTALLTIERANQLLATTTQVCKKGNNQMTLALTEAMSPNAYALVQVFAASKDNPRMAVPIMGMLPIDIKPAGVLLVPKITAPATVKVGQPLAISVAEAQGRPCEYTLAIVDEGLLNMTRFATPDPGKHFLSKQGLAVQNLWNGALINTQALSKMLLSMATGGDGFLMDKDQAAINARFRSLVKVIGPFRLAKGQSVSHSLETGEFMGKVRVMAILADNRAYGSAQQSVVIKSDLMLAASAPRTVGQGDELQIPVSVISTGKAKNATVELLLSGEGKLVSAARQTVRFDRAGRAMVWYIVRSDENRTGALRLKVVATSMDKDASGQASTHLWQATIPVRSDNISRTISQSVMAAPGQSAQAVIRAGQYIGPQSVCLSPLDWIDVPSEAQYLIQYPYGCMEQTASSGMAQLALLRMGKLSPDQIKKAQLFVKMAWIKIYQENNGDQTALPYWPGERQRSAFPTYYCAAFAEQLIRYKALTEGIEPNQLTSFVENLGLVVNNEPVSADLLLLKNLLGTPNQYNNDEIISLMQTGRLTPYQKALWYGTGLRSPVGFEEAASALTTLGEDNGLYGNQGMVLAALMKGALLRGDYMHLNQLLPKAGQLFGRDRMYYSTVFVATVLDVAATFHEKYGAAKGIIATLDANGKTQRIQVPTGSFSTQYPAVLSSDMRLTVTNQGKGPVFLTTRSKILPKRNQDSAMARNLTIQVRYLDENNKPLDPAQIQAGTKFFAQISVRRTQPTLDYTRMMLSMVMPGGWEPISNRLETGVASADYLDVRDDRLFQSFDLQQSERQFRIPIRAAHSGSYYLPGIRCESMYRPNQIIATTQGRPINVIRRP